MCEYDMWRRNHGQFHVSALCSDVALHLRLLVGYFAFVLWAYMLAAVYIESSLLCTYLAGQ